MVSAARAFCRVAGMCTYVLLISDASLYTHHQVVENNQTPAEFSVFSKHNQQLRTIDAQRHTSDYWQTSFVAKKS